MWFVAYLKENYIYMNLSKHTEFTTADAIVQELVREGVKVVFGIVSIHNLPIYDAINRNGTIRLITARGESGAVNMAEGYARSTGKIGVILTSTGAGAGNAAGSLTEAWNAGVPLLHVTGDVASPYLGTGKRYIHESKNQNTMMDGASKKSYLLKNCHQTTVIVRESIQEAKTLPSGPITLNIPIDLQSIIVPKSQILNLEDSKTFLMDKVMEIPRDVLKEITNASRPVIWAGGGVVYADAACELKSFAEKIGAAVITSESGKGVIPENHPLCIGHFGSYEATQKLLNNSDLLISIGVRFRGNETTNWTVVMPENHIGIDADPNIFNLNYTVKYGLTGNAKQILNQLLKDLPENSSTNNQDYLEEIKDVRYAVRLALEKTLGPYKEFAEVMRNSLSTSTILVRDVTVPASLWGSRLVDIHKPRTSIHANGGGIGQGLPMAIGAQVGCENDTVVLMVGDGGFLVNIGELATASQENLPLVIILFDDSGYGVLRGIQDATYGRRVGVELKSPDFETLGKSMGFKTSKVSDSVDFATELKLAINQKKPAIIVVDMKQVGPMAIPYQGSPAIMHAFRPKEL